MSSVTDPACPHLLEMDILMQDGVLLKGMVDSGATCSFIRSDILQKVGAATKEVEAMVVTLADNSTLECTQEAQVAFTFGCNGLQVGGTMYSGYRVIEQLTYDIVFGMDWLRSVNPTIDWLDYSMLIQQSDGS